MGHMDVLEGKAESSLAEAAALSLADLANLCIPRMSIHLMYTTFLWMQPAPILKGLSVLRQTPFIICLLKNSAV